MKQISKDLPQIFWYTLELHGKQNRGFSTEQTLDNYIKLQQGYNIGKFKEKEDTWNFKLALKDEGAEASFGFIFRLQLKQGKWTPLYMIR
ncbi:MAG: hypothetical protein MK193_04860 [Lentisphaeria bacterium]|nr:hypothetical protein [Lentisphaeria bacterium]